MADTHLIALGSKDGQLGMGAGAHGLDGVAERSALAASRWTALFGGGTASDRLDPVQSAGAIVGDDDGRLGRFRHGFLNHGFLNHRLLDHRLVFLLVTTHAESAGQLVGHATTAGSRGRLLHNGDQIGRINTDLVGIANKLDALLGLAALFGPVRLVDTALERLFSRICACAGTGILAARTDAGQAIAADLGTVTLEIDAGTGLGALPGLGADLSVGVKGGLEGAEIRLLGGGDGRSGQGGEG